MILSYGILCQLGGGFWLRRELLNAVSNNQRKESEWPRISTVMERRVTQSGTNKRTRCLKYRLAFCGEGFSFWSFPRTATQKASGSF